MYIGLHVKYRLFSSYFNETLIFWEQILEKYSNVTFQWKFVQLGAELLHADGRTDVQADMT